MAYLKRSAISLLLGSCHLLADGILGGTSGGSETAATFIPMSTTSVTLLSPLPAGSISSVALNDFNQAIVGGNSASAAIFAADISLASLIGKRLWDSGGRSLPARSASGAWYLFALTICCSISSAVNYFVEPDSLKFYFFTTV